MIQRAIRLVVPLLLMLAVAACAGDPEPRQELAAGYPGAAANSHWAAGDGTQAGWPGSPYPILSYDDREAIGRVAYAEAGNQGEEGIAAVIFTILNRANSGLFGSSVQHIIDARNQFEPATRAGGWRYLRPLDTWQSVQFDTILNLILAGRLPDLTNGALFFQNAEIVAARAARGKVSAYLVDFGGTPPVAEIGDHRFYDWRAAINLASRRHTGYVAETAYPTEETAATAVTEDGLAAGPGSDESGPENEVPGDGTWDEQAMPLTDADGIVPEFSGTQECSAGADC